MAATTAVMTDMAICTPMIQDRFRPNISTNGAHRSFKFHGSPRKFKYPRYRSFMPTSVKNTKDMLRMIMYGRPSVKYVVKHQVLGFLKKDLFMKNKDKID
jgi:hypothetical protein